MLYQLQQVFLEGDVLGQGAYGKVTRCDLGVKKVFKGCLGHPNDARHVLNEIKFLRYLKLLIDAKIENDEVHLTIKSEKGFIDLKTFILRCKFHNILPDIDLISQNIIKAYKNLGNIQHRDLKP